MTLAIQPSPRRVEVRADGVLVARSERAVIVSDPGGVEQLYVPREDVTWERSSPTGSPSAPGVIEPPADLPAVADMVTFSPDDVEVLLYERWRDGSEVAARFPIWGDASELLRLLDVAAGDDGRFVGPAHGPTARNVVEGGQLLGSAIVAASKSVPSQRVTSASMVFSRAATFDDPIDLDVDVLRGGRSFSTVEVRASQRDELRATALVLMDVGAEDVIRGVQEMPDVPGPDEAVPFPDFGVPGRDIRVVDGAYSLDPEQVGPPEIDVWVRFAIDPDEQFLHAALLAQSTTHWTIAAAMHPHPGVGEALAHVTLSTGIMKATIAFHDDADVSDWLLYTNRAIYAGRGQAQGDGRVFTRDGRLVASYDIQAMVRAFAQDPASMGHDHRSAM